MSHFGRQGCDPWERAGPGQARHRLLTPPPGCTHLLALRASPPRTLQGPLPRWRHEFRWGGRKTDGAWWQQYYLFGSVKNKSYTWSGADNLRRHFSGHRPATRISKTHNAQLGDIVFFKWKKERRYDHATVVTSKVQGHLGLSQHGIKNHTTLDDVPARYRGTSNPIQRVLIIRPRSAT
ncbi:amidase domain-containing protein [Streptomyces olivochromogenes]|uniref:amidase domain-containing protein n=1 Tax=Streptomyces olivochromogenes TaxID=1963 RepID=UPI00099F344C|nr:amidase domain-containing protein [Streptomyces olivochromogenes]